MNISSKLKPLLKNKIVLYVCFAITITNMFGYLIMKNYNAIMVFCATGMMARYFSKNMIVVLGIALTATNLFASVKLGLAVREGLVANQDDESANESEDNSGDNLEDVKTDNIQDSEKESIDELDNECEKDVTGKCITKEGLKTLSPARVDGDDSVGPNLDYAGSLEAAYDNLDKLLDSDAMKRMGNDTEKLAQKQKKLMGNIGKLQPLMKTATTMLEKLNFVNN